MRAGAAESSETKTIEVYELSQRIVIVHCEKCLTQDLIDNVLRV